MSVSTSAEELSLRGPPWGSRREMGSGVAGMVCCPTGGHADEDKPRQVGWGFFSPPAVPWGQPGALWLIWRRSTKSCTAWLAARGLRAPTAPGTGRRLLLQAGGLEVVQGKSFASPWPVIQESALPARCGWGWGRQHEAGTKAPE